MKENSLEENILNDILKDYFPDDFGKVNFNVVPLKGGLTNFNYHIKIERSADHILQYFLKVFRKADLSRVEGLVWLMRRLMKAQFPTPPLRSLHTEQKADNSLEITEADAGFWQKGEVMAIVTDFIKGVEPQRNTETMYQIGTLLAALHLIDPTEQGAQVLLHGYALNYAGRLEKISEHSNDTSSENTSENIRPKPVEKDIMELIDMAREHIDKLPFEKFPKSLIHGDIFMDNLIVNDHKDLWFIDFEGGCLDNSLFDLARAMIGCCHGKGTLNLELCNDLLSGYSMTRPLIKIENQFLYEYIIYAGTVSTLWRYTEFNLDRNTENRNHLYRELLAPVIDIIEQGKKSVMDQLPGLD